MTVVLESSDLRVILQQGRDDELWLSFAGLGDRQPSAPGFIASRNATALHFVSKTDDWFQAIPLRTRSLVERFRPKNGRLVSFGQSMGGFAALATSQTFGVDTVIVSAPQVVIDPDRAAGRDDRWASAWRGLTPGVCSDAREGLSAAPVHLFYDPRIREDRWQVSLLAKHPNVQAYRIPGAGHAIFHQLKELGLWQAFMQAALLDDSDDINRMITRLWRDRRNSYLYLCELGMALANRGKPALAERVYLRAIDLDPMHHKAWVWLRQTRVAAADLRGALEAAQGAACQVKGRETLWSLFPDLVLAATAFGDDVRASEALAWGRSELPDCQMMQSWRP